MIKGRQITLELDGEQIPASVSCSMTILQDVEEIEPLPELSDIAEEQWKTYRKGHKTWSASTKTLLTDQTTHMLGITGKEESIEIYLPGFAVMGTGIVTETKLDAAIDKLAIIATSMKGNEIPQIYDYDIQRQDN